MEIRRYPDLLGQLQRGRTTAQIRERLQTVSTEAVTGLKSDVTKATNGALGDGHLLRKAINDVEQIQGINALSQTRLSLMTGAISGSRESIDDIHTRGTVILEQNNAVGLDIIASEAEASLESIMSAFSVSHGNRYLFSGDRTQTPPFADTQQLLDDVRAIMTTAATPAEIETALDQYFNDPAGGFQTTIYQGTDTPPPPLPYADGKSAPITLTGQSSDIKDALRGLAVLATAQDFNSDITSTPFRDVFTQGLTSVSNANQAFITLEGQMGIYASQINQSNERLSDEAQILSTAFQDMFGRDQFEAAGELKALEAQLQASYTITARLSDLTLTNFIR